jgi:hypothetical protein
LKQPNILIGPVVNGPQPLFAVAQSVFGALARSDVAICLERIELTLVVDADKPALNHNFATIARDLSDLSVPTSLFRNPRFDVPHGNVSASLEQLMADTADRVFGGIAV